MDFQFIEKLAKLMKQECLTEIEIKNPKKDEHIKLKYNVQQTIIDHTKSFSAPQVINPNNATCNDKDTIEIRSPFVGTFYSSSSPDAASYVSIGSTVKKGQTLCIVEAMKMMNEIEAEVSGTVTEILIKNEHPVEYNQVLFKIKA